jgi:hypothetical protein
MSWGSNVRQRASLPRRHGTASESRTRERPGPEGAQRGFGHICTCAQHASLRVATSRALTRGQHRCWHRCWWHQSPVHNDAQGWYMWTPAHCRLYMCLGHHRKPTLRAEYERSPAASVSSPGDRTRQLALSSACVPLVHSHFTMLPVGQTCVYRGMDDALQM